MTGGSAVERRGLAPSSTEDDSPGKLPMPQPESYRITSRTSSAEAGSAEAGSDLRDVVRTLATHGGGVDLALDLILNEVVEQARLATGATGAAIALGRAGEMVCRATTGGNAPDLGMRLETTSGLSGACLQSGKIQLCSDTATDPRVDAEACQRLGVRSILVLPLMLPTPTGGGLGAEKEAFGIMEVFSARAQAFGERDVSTLEVLARRVVAEKQGAEKVSAQGPGVEAATNAASTKVSSTDTASINTASTKESKTPLTPELARESGSGVRDDVRNEVPTDLRSEVHTEVVADVRSDVRSEVRNDERPRRRSDVWSFVLGILVIATAVVLGLALGWRGAIVSGLQEQGRRQEQGSQERANGASTVKGISVDAGQGTSTAPAGDLAGGNSAAIQPSAAQTKAAGAAATPTPPSGGLLVTENGKVIYRLSPSGPGASGSTRAASTAAGSSPGSSLSTTDSGAGETSATRLIHRVEPEYPAEAAAQRIQGVVTLDVQIGAEGAVHNIAVVDGNPLLVEAAVQAVRQWRYQPYAVDGRPAGMQTRITIRFKLPGS
jgi:TonB family protein